MEVNVHKNKLLFYNDKKKNSSIINNNYQFEHFQNWRIVIGIVNMNSIQMELI